MSDEQKKAFVKALQSNEAEYSRLARAAILADIQDEEENSMIDKKFIKSYPYFIDWLKELGRSVDDVEHISAEAEAIELPTENGWRRYEPPKFMQVGVTFTDGQIVVKRIAISDFTYLSPEEVDRRDTSDALQIVRKVAELDLKEYPELQGLIEEAHEFIRWIEGA